MLYVLLSQVRRRVRATKQFLFTDTHHGNDRAIHLLFDTRAKDRRVTGKIQGHEFAKGRTLNAWMVAFQGFATAVHNVGDLRKFNVGSLSHIQTFR
jgi:hypothetical protein